jgi:hypothetical protein
VTLLDRRVEWTHNCGMYQSVAATLLFLAACGPAPGYVEEPEAEQPPRPLAPPEASRQDQFAACRMSTPAVRLQSRTGRHVGVEGMNSLACPPEPATPGAR